MKIGPIVVRWYAGLHRRAIFGLITALLLKEAVCNGTQQLEDLLFYATIGVIIGGRLGYVLFYNPVTFLIRLKSY